MLATALVLFGFVVLIVAILGFTPKLEEWATSAQAPGETGDAGEEAARP